MNVFRYSRRIVGVLALALLPLAFGCTNPFQPADPEPPSGDAVVEDFSTPAAVLETMRKGIESRSTNGANAYLHAFTESFGSESLPYRSFYDDAVKSAWESANQITAPEPWDLLLERNVHTRLSSIRPTYPYHFQWAPDQASPADDDFNAADTAQYHRKYTLLAAPPNGDPEIIAIGFADLSFQKERSGRWSVYRWHDRLDPAVGVNPALTTQRTFSYWRLESLHK